MNLNTTAKNIIVFAHLRCELRDLFYDLEDAWERSVKAVHKYNSIQDFSWEYVEVDNSLELSGTEVDNDDYHIRELKLSIPLEIAVDKEKRTLFFVDIAKKNVEEEAANNARIAAKSLASERARKEKEFERLRLELGK
jgi:hypothetical protein